MNPDADLIRAEDLQVGRGTVLLRSVSLRLQAGECWFVLGRNGVGKSTLVQTMLGLLPPLGGVVHQGNAIADRSGLGYVPQEQRFPASLPLTVQEFVRLGLPEHALARREAKARTDAALAAMHILELRRRNSSDLSLGQRRRVLVARALARRPLLLVLDEPTANLDPFGAGQLGQDLERLRADQGICLLHVCHDLALAQRHGTHVALCANGKVKVGAAAAMFAAAETQQALGLGATV